jgi:hypothetical protein
MCYGEIYNMKAKIVVMTSNNYNRIMNLNKFLCACFNCGININIRDKYVSKTSHNNHRKAYKIYCLLCAEKLKIIILDNKEKYRLIHKKEIRIYHKRYVELHKLKIKEYQHDYYLRRKNII